LKYVRLSTRDSLSLIFDYKGAALETKLVSNDQAFLHRLHARLRHHGGQPLSHLGEIEVD
jgi:hypothetical protein